MRADKEAAALQKAVDEYESNLAKLVYRKSDNKSFGQILEVALPASHSNPAKASELVYIVGYDRAEIPCASTDYYLRDPYPSR